MILDSSVGLSAGIQSAEDWVSETPWVRILHSAEEDNLSPFDSKIACLCQSIEINNNKYVLENSKRSSPLLVTTGTAVASDKFVRVRLTLKKWTNIQEASG